MTTAQLALEYIPWRMPGNSDMMIATATFRHFVLPDKATRTRTYKISC